MGECVDRSLSNGGFNNGEPSYQGHGAHKSLPNGKSSGVITISSGVIRFQPGGDAAKDIRNGGGESFAIEGSEFSLGGASNRLVFIRHSTRTEWSFYTSDRSILNNPLLQNVPSVSQQLSAAKRTRWFNHTLLAAVIGVVLLIPLVLFLSMDSFTGMAAKQVPAEWEQKVGETVYAQYQMGKTLMPEEEAEKILLPIVEPLLAALQESYGSTQNDIQDQRFTPHFSIVYDPEVNAFALPGGYVVINSGLILAADSADEILGVLAHELSHVTEQHGLRNVIGAASTYLMIDLLLGDVSGVIAMIADAAPLLLNQRFSRSFEREADEKGYELLVNANINPQGLASFFEKLMLEREKQLGKIEDESTRELMAAAEGLLSSHPATEERIEYLKSLAKSNDGPYIELTEAFDELKNTVKVFVVSNDNE